VAEKEHARGPSDAEVTIVEYGDFECPYCAATEPTLRALARDIRVVYRHFPIASAHPHARIAAEAAEAAGAQGKFWEMHDLLFDHQDALTPKDLLSYADKIGLNLEHFADDLRTHVHLPRVEADFWRGIEEGVNGTPTLFINGVRYDGPRDRTSLRNFAYSTTS
jgi:protein-disulfide isomerase